MKKYIRTVYVFAGVCLFMQCRVQEMAVEGPENFSNIKATVEMHDNTIYKGFLSLNKTKNKTTAYIRISQSGKILPLNLDSVRSYYTDLGLYESKQLHPSEKGISVPLQHAFGAFAKRISSSDGPIAVYEYEECTPAQKSCLTKTIKYYYATLPGADNAEIWELDGEKFSPGFNEKMAVIFAADKSLVEKIFSGEKNYSYKPFSFTDNSKVKIVLNLLTHYKANDNSTN